jgi:hypothetical protein
MPIKTDKKEYTTVQEWFDDMGSKFNWFERNIEIPFYRYFWNYVREFYYGLIHLPGNISKWGKFVWNDRDWEYAYTLEALEIKCRAQANCLKKGYAENSELHAQQALDCEEALKRLRMDEYVDYRLEISGNKRDATDVMKEYSDKRNVDLEIVHKSFENINRWWD